MRVWCTKKAYLYRTWAWDKYGFENLGMHKIKTWVRGGVPYVVVPVAGLLRKKSGPSEDITTLPMRHHKGRYYYQIWLADQNRDTTSLGINTGWFLCLANIENSALKITLHQAALLKESLPNGAVTRLFQ